MDRKPIESERVAFWAALRARLLEGQRVFLALVVAHTKHSPGTTGARMFITEKGETRGTIGGGIMEFNLIERAKDILAGGSFIPECQTLYHRKTGQGEKSGMICAGHQTNLYYVCRPAQDGPIVADLLDYLRRDTPAALKISEAGMQLASSSVPLPPAPIVLTEAEGTWMYEEQLLPYKRIAILGGGHCALALSRVVHHLDYHVTVFETRPDVDTLTRNTFAQTIHVVDDYREAGSRIPFPTLTSVIVMTTDALSDVRGVQGLLDYAFPFIGVMGSKAKVKFIFDQLRQADIAASALSQIHAPVGLPIGSNTPEEIAISIAAQLLQQPF